MSVRIGMRGFRVAVAVGTTMTFAVTGAPAVAAGPEFSVIEPAASIGADPSDIATGDLNGDGVPDVVVANQTDDTVTVLLGNKGLDGKGTGTFTTASTPKVGDRPNGIALSDLNGDGVLDAVVANRDSGDLTVLLALTGTDGKGTGTFTASTLTVVDPNAGGDKDVSSVGVGDVDGDGIRDLIAANNGDGTVAVLLGRKNSPGGTPNGTFDGPVFTATGASTTYRLVVTDVNGDGRADVVTVGYTSVGTVAVTLLGTGDEDILRRQATVTRVAGPSEDLETGDMNNDGIPDVVSASPSNGTVHVLLGTAGANGKGTGAFTALNPVLAVNSPRGVSLGDLNRDGVLDAVAANDFPRYLPDESQEYHATVLLGTKGADGRGTGVLTVASRPANGTGAAPTQPLRVAVADLNGDGFPDFVTANGASSTLSSFVQNPPAVTPGGGGGGGGPSGGSLGSGDVTLDFGRGPSRRTTTVTNVGGSRATLQAATVEGTNADQYKTVAARADTGACQAGTVLPPGDSCTVTVQFAPTTPGTKTATLLVPSDSSTSPLRVAMTGEGTTPAAASSSGGTATASSVGAVTSAPSTTGAGAGASPRPAALTLGTIVSGQAKRLGARRLPAFLRAGAFATRFTAPAAGRLRTIVRAGDVTLASALVTVAAGQRQTVRATLRPRGRAALRRAQQAHRALPVVLTYRFVPADGRQQVQSSAPVTLRP